MYTNRFYLVKITDRSIATVVDQGNSVRLSANARDKREEESSHGGAEREHGLLDVRRGEKVL